MHNREDDPRSRVATLLIGLHSASILVGLAAIAVLVHAETQGLFAGSLLTLAVLIVLVLGLVGVSVCRLRALWGRGTERESTTRRRRVLRS